MVRPGVVGSDGAVGLWLEWERAGVVARLPLDRPLVIGRDPSSDIHLTEPTASRRHAVVSLVGGQVVVDASGSTNGIKFDRGRAERVTLSPGQSFQIGDTGFRVMGAPAGQAMPALPAPSQQFAPPPMAGPPAYGQTAVAFGQPPALYHGSPAPRRGTAGSAIAVGLIAVLVVGLLAAGVGYFVLTGQGSGAGSLGMAAASLDPDAPEFPVPAGSTLINAQMEGTGAAAYRLTAWQSGKDYATTAAFYTGLNDSRWQMSGSPAMTPQSTSVAFADNQGVFTGAEVEVTRTEPVKIEVRFVPSTMPVAPSFGPGPTVALHPLPAATALPDGFPPELIPPGTTLEDAGAVDSTYFAIFSGSVDVSAYETQIGSLVQITATHTESGATVIDFTLKGKPGQIVVDPARDETSVEVTV